MQIKCENPSEKSAHVWWHAAVLHVLEQVCSSCFVSWNQNVACLCPFTHLSRTGWAAEVWPSIQMLSSFFSFPQNTTYFSNCSYCPCDAGSLTPLRKHTAHFSFISTWVCVYVFLCLCVLLVWSRSWWWGDSFLPLKPSMGVFCWYIKIGRKGGSRKMPSSSVAQRAKVSVCWGGRYTQLLMMSQLY